MSSSNQVDQNFVRGVLIALSMSIFFWGGMAALIISLRQ